MLSLFRHSKTGICIDDNTQENNGIVEFLCNVMLILFYPGPFKDIILATTLVIILVTTLVTTLATTPATIRAPIQAEATHMALAAATHAEVL